MVLYYQVEACVAFSHTCAFRNSCHLEVGVMHVSLVTVLPKAIFPLPCTPRGWLCLVVVEVLQCLTVICMLTGLLQQCSATGKARAFTCLACNCIVALACKPLDQLRSVTCGELVCSEAVKSGHGNIVCIPVEAPSPKVACDISARTSAVIERIVHAKMSGLPVWHIASAAHCMHASNFTLQPQADRHLH